MPIKEYLDVESVTTDEVKHNFDGFVPFESSVIAPENESQDSESERPPIKLGTAIACLLILICVFPSILARFDVEFFSNRNSQSEVSDRESILTDIQEQKNLSRPKSLYPDSIADRAITNVPESLIGSFVPKYDKEKVTFLENRNLNNKEAVRLVQGSQNSVARNHGEIVKKEKLLFRNSKMSDTVFEQGKEQVLFETNKVKRLKGLSDIYKSIDQGNSSAMEFLGCCFARGWVVPRNKDKAIKFLELAIDNGCLKANNTLGQLLLESDKLELAVHKFELGANHGDSDCMVSLARCFWDGFGVQINRELGLNWFRSAAKLGNSDALLWCKKHQIELSDLTTPFP